MLSCSVLVLSLSLLLFHPLQKKTVKPVLSGHSKRRPKLVFKSDYRLMQVNRIEECSTKAFCNVEHSAIHVLSTFIKLQFDFKTFVLSIFEWLLKTCFTVNADEISESVSNALIWKLTERHEPKSLELMQSGCLASTRSY